MLREYAKTNADWVKQFVAANTLLPLSKREALKHFRNHRVSDICNTN